MSRGQSVLTHVLELSHPHLPLLHPSLLRCLFFFLPHFIFAGIFRLRISVFRFVVFFVLLFCQHFVTSSWKRCINKLYYLLNISSFVRHLPMREAKCQHPSLWGKPYFESRRREHSSELKNSHHTYRSVIQGSNPFASFSCFFNQLHIWKHPKKNHKSSFK